MRWQSHVEVLCFIQKHASIKVWSQHSHWSVWNGNIWVPQKKSCWCSTGWKGKTCHSLQDPKGTHGDVLAIKGLSLWHWLMLLFKSSPSTEHLITVVCFTGFQRESHHSQKEDCCPSTVNYHPARSCRLNEKCYVHTHCLPASLSH